MLWPYKKIALKTNKKKYCILMYMEILHGFLDWYVIINAYTFWISLLKNGWQLSKYKSEFPNVCFLLMCIKLPPFYISSLDTQYHVCLFLIIFQYSENDCLYIWCEIWKFFIHEQPWSIMLPKYKIFIQDISMA